MGIVTNTTKPVIPFDYDDEDNDPMVKARVRIYGAEEFLKSDFDPNVAPWVADSGAIYDSQARSWVCTEALANGSTYRAFVQVNDGNFWSPITAAGPYAEFTIDVEPPATPIISIVTQDEPPHAEASVSSFNNMLSLNASNGTEDGTTTGFSGAVNCSFISNPTFATDGDHVVSMTATASGAMSLLVNDKAIQVTEGASINALAEIRAHADGVQRAVTLFLLFYDKYGTLLTTVTGPSITEFSQSDPLRAQYLDNGWAQPFIVDAIAPAGAAVASLKVSVAGASAGETHHVDSLLVTSGPLNLIRNPLGLRDTGTGLGRFWSLVNTGTGSNPAFGFSGDKPLTGDRSSHITVTTNTGTKGIQQPISLPAGYGFATVWVRPVDQDAPFTLACAEIGSTTVTAQADTWTPIKLKGAVSAPGSSGRTVVTLTTTATNLEFDWTLFQVGPLPNSTADIDPALEIRPNNWSVGGIGGTVTHEIQRSDDGGETWIEVRRIDEQADYHNGAQSYDVTDWEIPGNNLDVMYRARTTHYDSTTGLSLSSLWSFNQRIINAPAAVQWWLIPPNDPTARTPVVVLFGSTFQETERQADFALLGRDATVTLHGEDLGQSGNLKFDTVSKEEHDAFIAAWRLRDTFVLVNPIGETLFVDLGEKVSWTPKSDVYKEASVEFRESARPPVSAAEASPFIPAPVVPGGTPPTPPTPPSSTTPTTGFTHVSTEDFNSGSYTPAEWSILNNGRMTSDVGAWMSRDVSVVGGKLRLKAFKNSSPITVNGKQYLVEGGYAIYKGPSNVAVAKGGQWVAKGVVVSGNSLGYGFVILLWPSPYGNDWPISGEIDVLELYASNASKLGGEANLHLDTVANSPRHRKIPGPTTNSPAAMVTAGNFQIDWTVPHDVNVVWINNSYVEIFIDNISVGKVTDQSYVPHDSTSDPMRLTFQTEHYGVSDSATGPGPFNVDIDSVEYWSFP